MSSERRSERVRSGFFGLVTSRRPADRSLDTLRLLQTEQTLAHHEEVRQRTGDHEPMPVLRQAAITDFGEAEDALDHAQGMLDPGAHAGLPAIGLPLGAAQGLLPPRLALGEVAGVGRAGAEDRVLPGVGRVAPHAPLPAVEQPGQHLTVVSWTLAGVASTE